MDDAEKLWLYAQSPITKHQALDASLTKAKFRSKHWEWEAKASANKITGAENEMVEAKEEAQVFPLIVVGDTKARPEDVLVRV